MLHPVNLIGLRGYVDNKHLIPAHAIDIIAMPIQHYVAISHYIRPLVQKAAIRVVV